VSFFDYHDEKIKKSIIHGKYYFLSGAYDLLGKLIAQQILTRDYKNIFNLKINNQESAEHSTLLAPNSSLPFTLTPIPLAKSRQRWRGFNQAEVLCKSLSSELGLPLAHTLKRKKSTKTQKDLKRNERITNVQDAFAVSPPARGGVPRATVEGGGGSEDNILIKNNNFLLVDDVTTTGSTLLEAAKVLKRNGAAKVWCLTVARD
jgi:predicted amidophosphoribosyltransferase